MMFDRRTAIDSTVKRRSHSHAPQVKFRRSETRPDSADPLGHCPVTRIPGRIEECPVNLLEDDWL